MDVSFYGLRMGPSSWRSNQLGREINREYDLPGQ